VNSVFAASRSSFDDDVIDIGMADFFIRFIFP
jgi:hypothetical protein